MIRRRILDGMQDGIHFRGSWIPFKMWFICTYLFLVGVQS